jgi:hypothetical protein
VTRTLHYDHTCDDCKRFGSVGFLTYEQTGWPPHEPMEVTACWPGGGLPPTLADPLDAPCALFAHRRHRWKPGEQPTLL